MLVVENGAVTVEPLLAARGARAEEPRSDEEWLEAVRDGVFASAVRKRLVADVPLGALLSGGIDSSIVVAAMAQESSDPVRTFSVGFTEPRYDERSYARLGRRALRHDARGARSSSPTRRRSCRGSWMRTTSRSRDSSALPTFLVCEHARRFVTVALVGDGGDEIFGGYERYRAHALAERLDRRPAAPPRPRGARAAASRRHEACRARPLFRAARFFDTAGLDPTRALRAG